MDYLADIAKGVRADVRASIATGALRIPPFVKVTVRVDRRGMAPSVNAYFTPVGDVQDEVAAWKYTTRGDGTRVLSPAIEAAGAAIIDMIKVHSHGSCYASVVNRYGTAIAIIII